MKKIRRSTLIPAILFVYLCVMASIGWADYASGRTSALNYFGVIAITLIILVLLHLSLRRRERLRREREDDINENSNT